MDKVIVKVFNEEGYWLLSEIRGLKEGTIVEGKFDKRNKGFDFKWNGSDAVLWLGVNCKKYSPKRRLEKGFIPNVMCWAVTNVEEKFLECGGSKKEVLDLMKERNYSRNEFTIKWVVRDYNTEKDFEGWTEGVGYTKKEALDNFYEKYYA